MKNRFVLIVNGPTGVGKTEFVDRLAKECALEVINGDTGQMYVPLTIGTAKPDLQSASVPYHFFDILSKPISFSAMKFRRKVITLISEIWERNRIPVIVGGSSFYLLSLFFPVPDSEKSVIPESSFSEQDLWKKLHDVDPKRADEIHPKDLYRLERALLIWHATGIKPSEYKPQFNPFAPCIFVWLTRDREDLYQKINARVKTMLQDGWIEEVQRLRATDWEPFLKNKKIIGYDTIFEFLEGSKDRETVIQEIQKKTRNYAKRQMTFWRSFKRKLQEGFRTAPEPKTPLSIIELNLTHEDVEGYIKQLKNLLL